MADEPELQKGQSGEWVRYLQQMLQYAGYWQGEADGQFGDELEQAVMQLQSASGLAADGVVGAGTWNALNGGTSGGSGDGSGGSGEEGGENDPDSVYVDTSYLQITAALVNANGDADTYLASIGIDPQSLTREAIA
jgi:peptidoglycan hydrolase-like protein with peptidoglycan-binding domain